MKRNNSRINAWDTGGDVGEENTGAAEVLASSRRAVEWEGRAFLAACESRPADSTECCNVNLLRNARCSFS